MALLEPVKADKEVEVMQANGQVINKQTRLIRNNNDRKTKQIPNQINDTHEKIRKYV